MRVTMIIINETCKMWVDIRAHFSSKWPFDNNKKSWSPSRQKRKKSEFPEKRPVVQEPEKLPNVNFMCFFTPGNIKALSLNRDVKLLHLKE